MGYRARLGHWMRAAFVPRELPGANRQSANRLRDCHSIPSNARARRRCRPSEVARHAQCRASHRTFASPRTRGVKESHGAELAKSHQRRGPRFACRRGADRSPGPPARSRFAPAASSGCPDFARRPGRRSPVVGKPPAGARRSRYRRAHTPGMPGARLGRTLGEALRG